MKPGSADPLNRAEFPQIDACSKALFGLTGEEAENAPRPADWDGIEHRPVRDQVAAFEAAGWDVTDDKRRPLRMLAQFSAPLWLAVRGVAGELPFSPPPKDDEPGEWGSSLAAEAARFKKR
jgi:hypothetical protein